jgi:hypothetical protein
MNVAKQILQCGFNFEFEYLGEFDVIFDGLEYLVPDQVTREGGGVVRLENHGCKIS